MDELDGHSYPISFGAYERRGMNLLILSFESTVHTMVNCQGRILQHF